MQDSGQVKRTRFVLAGAFLTVFLAAFEVKTPVFSLGPVGFTTSELAAGFFFITFLVWARREALSSIFLRRVLDVAVLVFIASNFFSILAAEDRPSALKFSLRMTYATMVYFCISRLPRKTKSHVLIARAVTSALLVVVLIGLMENFIPYIDWPRLLSPFQEGIITFGTFYNVRVASTLPFPTTLSMYLELAVPMALALAVWMIEKQKKTRPRRWLTIATIAGLVAAMAVQVYTFTRSALVATPVSMLTGAVVAIVFGYSKKVWGFFLAAVILMLVITGASVLLSNKMATRLDLAQQEQRYGAEYILVSFPDKLPYDSQVTARFHIKNTSSTDWSIEGNGSVVMSSYLVTYPGKEILDDISYVINDLPHEVPRGGELDMSVDFNTPREPGKYVIVFGLSKSSVGWFSSSGVRPVIVAMDFNGGGGKVISIPEGYEFFNFDDPVVIQASRTELWKAAFKTWKTSMVLGVGPDQFRRRYQEFAPELPPDQRVRTHNIFLEALTNTGLVGLASMVFLLAATLFAQMRLVRNRKLKPSERYVSLALLVATVAYVVHGMLDCFLWQTGISFLFFAYLGLTSWLSQRASLDQ